MRENRMKKGVEVLNKLNGKVYLIEDVNYGKAYATEKIGEDKFTRKPVLGEDKIVLTKENLIFFRVVYDPNLKDIPCLDDYNLSDGILTQNGVPVTRQGEIYISKILGTVQLKLILLCKIKGTYQIQSYCPFTDEFMKLYDSKVDDAAPQEFETDEFYSYYFCKTFTEPATSETPEKVKLVTAKVVNIMKETGKIYVVDLPAPMEKAADTADTLLFNSKLKVNEEGYVKECNSYSVMVSNDDCYNLDIADVCFAKKYWVCDKGYVIKNDEYLVVTNLCGETLYEIKDPTAVKELSSFYTLIDVKQEREKTAFLFGNDDFFAKKCVVEKTYDRGDIVTVEDYTVE